MSGLGSNESSVVSGPWGQRDEVELEEAAAELEAEKKAANENTPADVAQPQAGASNAEIEAFIKKVWGMAVKATLEKNQPLLDSYEELVAGYRKFAMRVHLVNRGLRSLLAVVTSIALVELLILVLR